MLPWDFNINLPLTITQALNCNSVNNANSEMVYLSYRGVYSFYGKIGHLFKGLLGVENANKEKNISRWDKLWCQMCFFILICVIGQSI